MELGSGGRSASPCLAGSHLRHRPAHDAAAGHLLRSSALSILSKVGAARPWVGRHLSGTLRRPAISSHRRHKQSDLQTRPQCRPTYGKTILWQYPRLEINTGANSRYYVDAVRPGLPGNVIVREGSSRRGPRWPFIGGSDAVARPAWRLDRVAGCPKILSLFR